MQRLLILALASMIVLIFAPLAFAPNGGIPHLINYQGVLTDDEGNVLNAPQNLTFRIFDVESGGMSLWGETQNNVPVNEGLFNVILGSLNPINLPFDEDYWLEIEVGILGPLSPRAKLTSVGYAYRAEYSDTSDYSFKALRADTADYATVAVAAESDSDWTISGSDMYSAVSGNVGIGTSSPTSPLTIQPVLGPDIEFAGGSWNADIMADRQFNVGTSNASTFSLITDNQYRLLIQGGGNVGIGTVSPAAKLEVYYDNTNSNSATIAIDNGTGMPRQDVFDFKFGGVTEARIRKATSGDFFIGTLDNKGMKFQTDATNRMVIANTGEVGIGTESPAEKLHVNGNLKVTGKINGAIGLVAAGTYDSYLREGFNVGSISYNSTDDRYEIALTGINYDYRDYVTVVTPAGSTPYFVTTNSLSNELLIYFYDKGGNSVQATSFHFAVYDIE